MSSQSTESDVSSASGARTRVIAVVVWAMLVSLPAFARQAPAFEGTLSCSAGTSSIRNGSFRLSVGRVQLVDGKACVKPFADYRGCEWTVDLVRAERWGHEGRFLVVALDSIHDTPGASRSVLVYECRKGSYQSVFAEEFGPRGATLNLGGEDTFDVVMGEWLPGDAGCCPSRERRTTYRWDDDGARFVRVP